MLGLEHIVMYRKESCDNIEQDSFLDALQESRKAYEKTISSF